MAQAAPSDTDRGGREELGQPDSGTVEPGLEAPRRPHPDRCDEVAPDTEGDEGRERDRDDSAVADAHGGRQLERDEGQWGVPVADQGGAVAWGDYQPAIERWEHVLGRPAPAPVDERGRLSVDFVEWMQGFDEGWVDGLTRTAALKCLGNAVVQQQGILALSDLAGT